MSDIIKTQAVASDLDIKEVTGLDKVERVLDDDVLLLIRPVSDGSQKCYSVRGRLFHGEDAYQIAVKNGFSGTYEDWQDAVKKVVDVQPLADNLIKVTEDAQTATAEAISATEAIRLVIEQVNAAEAIRTSNEAERQTNENSRKSAEDSREANEQARNTSEDARKENETARTTAENKRVAAEEKREADFSASKDAADKATDKALSTYSHPPRVDDDGYYYVWNPDTQSYNKTETNLTGKAFSIKKVFASVSDMEATDVNTFDENDFILINTADVEDEDNAKLYVVARNDEGNLFYSYLVDMSGFRGFTGKTPQLIVGNVESLGEDEEAAASVTYSDVDSEGNPVYKVNFGIPKGRSFKFADFTEDQIEALKKPATDAANDSKKQTALCETATSNANDAASNSNSQTLLCKEATDAAQDVIDKFSDLIAAINIEVSGDGNAIADVSQDGSKLKFTKAGFLERFEMNASSNKFDANNFNSGITFAYTETHSNVPTTGTLVSFAPKKFERYAFQLQGRYTDDSLYFRRHDGDSSIWGYWQEIIHSGNIGQQSVKNSDMVDGVHNGSLTASYFGIVTDTGDFLTKPAGICDMDGLLSNAPLGETRDNFGLLTLGTESRRKYIAIQYGSGDAYINTKYTYDNSTYLTPGWKKLAFTSDNVASATKLETPRTLWGQSFDGTRNVSGRMFAVWGIRGGYDGACNIELEGEDISGYDQIGESRKANTCLNSWYGISISSEFEGEYKNKITVGINARNGCIATVGKITARGTITGASSSDFRLKKNIHSLDCLSIIQKMGGTVGFEWKENGEKSIGFIAQRVQKNQYMKDLVTCGNDGYLKINYWSPKLIAVSFGAIEQVGTEVVKLKARIRKFEQKIKKLEKDSGE